MGKLTISMAIFNSYVSHYQRVPPNETVGWTPPLWVGSRPPDRPPLLILPHGAGDVLLMELLNDVIAYRELGDDGENEAKKLEEYDSV